MRFPRLRRIAAVAALLLLAAAAGLTVAPPPREAAAADDKLPPELLYVPTDAAVFGHLDAAALYDGKLGDAIKKAKAKSLTDTLEEFAKSTGRELKDIKSYTFAFPKMADLGDISHGLSVVAFRVDYDRAKLTATLKEAAEKNKDEFDESKGVIRVKSKFNRHTVYDLTDAKLMVRLDEVPEGLLTPAKTLADGPQAEAIRLAAKSTAVFGVNFDALPPMLRELDTPEVRPFKPLFNAQTAVAVANWSGEKLDVSVRVRTKSKDAAAEAEKSLDAVKGLAATGLGTMKSQAADELEGDAAKAVTKLLAALETGVMGAMTGTDGADAMASLSLPTDLPWTVLVETVFGANQSARAVSQNNLKQLALANFNYESAMGTFPPAALVGKKGKKLLSWRVQILPYVEQDELYKKFHLDEPWDSEHNALVLKDNPMPKVFALPGSTDEKDKTTHYQVFTDNGALFDTAKGPKFADITDGSSNTVMIATAAKPVGWTQPDDLEFDPQAEVKPKLLFAAYGCPVAYGDGSVRPLKKTIDEKTLKAIITRAGGEVVTVD